jgi:outer membrane protein OmpA-like peptidoglycan-associated protein
MAKSSDHHWIPLADLMTGLMMMFMLIAVLYMLQVNTVVSEYSTSKDELGRDLCKEFASDLKEWDADCDDANLIVRFKSPDVLFDTGQSIIKPQFKSILSDFFPRYINLLNQEKYKNSIEEIRIEGHTSSKWSEGVSDNDAYFSNMQLSQARTLSVLQYVLSEKNTPSQSWTKNLLTANGLSSSKLIYDTDGNENRQGSQRVEFRVRTNADEHMKNIIDDLGQKQ